ncbi:hypothetical protein N9W84_01490 [bacterium]|nr:hypothetical protein [bacterium]
MTKLFKRIKKPNEKRVIDFLVELGMSSDYRYTSYQSIEEYKAKNLFIDNNDDLRKFCIYLNRKNYPDFLKFFKKIIKNDLSMECILKKGSKTSKDFKEIVSLGIKDAFGAIVNKGSNAVFDEKERFVLNKYQDIISFYLKENLSILNFQELSPFIGKEYFNKKELIEFILNNVGTSQRAYFLAHFDIMDSNDKELHLKDLLRNLHRLNSQSWIGREDRLMLRRTCFALTKIGVKYSELDNYSHKIRGTIYRAYIKNNMLDDKLAFVISRDKTTSYAYEVAKDICNHIDKYENAKDLLMPFIKCKNQCTIRSFAHNLDLKYMHIIIANKILRRDYYSILDRRKKLESEK